MPRRLLLALLLLATGCSGTGSASDPPAIEAGVSTCSACGMTIRDLRFAAAWTGEDGEVLRYDDVACLLRDLRDGLDPAGAWLSDFTAPGSLHRAAAMVLVRADFPSPMGGGYAAFSDPGTARVRSKERNGISGRLTEFVDGPPAPRKEAP